MRCVVALKLLVMICMQTRSLNIFINLHINVSKLKKEIYHMLDGVASANRVDFKIFL